MKPHIKTHMTRRIVVVAVAGLTVSACSSGSTAPKSAANAPTALAKATADCNQAIMSDQVVTAQALKACNTADVPTSYRCLHGPSVYEAYIPTGNDALLRLGYKPVVYAEESFYVSETKQLCGDPIDPSLTPPMPPLTQSQVMALFQSLAPTAPAPVATAPSVTAVPTTNVAAANTASCAGVFAKYGSIASNTSNTIPAPIATLVANGCSPADLQTYITQYLPAAYTAMAPGFTKKIEGLICPANPQTKLCP